MPTVIACMNDLMFLSKIVEATKALDIPLRSLKNPEKVIAACRDAPGTLVFLDLDDQTLDAIVIAKAIRTAQPAVDARVYTFVSHVHEDRIQLAGDNLFDRVFSRGQFVRALPELLVPKTPSSTE